MRTISVEEYQALTEFCIKHGVKYYDLQVELNDHLANAIEEIWTTKPAITFDEALEQVHKGFGKTGFRSFVKSKEIACQKRANKLFWNAFQSFFKWPHAVLVLLMILLYVIIYLQINSASISTIINILTIIIIIANIVPMVLAKKHSKKPAKPLLVTQYYGKSIIAALPDCLLATLFVNLLTQGSLFVSSYNLALYIMISSLQLICVIVAISTYHTSIALHKDAATHYPKAFT